MLSCVSLSKYSETQCLLPLKNKILNTGFQDEMIMNNYSEWSDEVPRTTNVQTSCGSEQYSISPG